MGSGASANLRPAQCLPLKRRQKNQDQPSDCDEPVPPFELQADEEETEAAPESTVPEQLSAPESTALEQPSASQKQPVLQRQPSVRHYEDDSDTFTKKFLERLGDVELVLSVTDKASKSSFCRLLDPDVVIAVCDTVADEVRKEKYLDDKRRYDVLKRCVDVLKVLTKLSEEVSDILMAHTTLVPLLLQKLGNGWGGNGSPEGLNELVAGCLHILHGVSKYSKHAPDLRKCLTDSEDSKGRPPIFDILNTFLRSQKQTEENRLTAAVTLANLVTDAGDMTAGVLKLPVDAASQALGGQLQGWTARDLLNVLHQLAEMRSVRKPLLEAGILDLLEKCMESSVEIREEAAKILWELSFHPMCAKEISKRENIVGRVIDTYKETKETRDSKEVSEAGGIVFNLHENLEENEQYKEIEPDIKPQPRPGKRHVMISYNHGSKETVHKLYTFLTKRGLIVWLDENEMQPGTSLLKSMAEAVEGASAFLMCMSKAYYDSRNCHLEAEYAHKKQVPIFPLRMEKYEPELWLGLLCGDTMYIDFTDNNFDKNADKLFTALKKVLDEQKQASVASVSPATHTDSEKETVQKTAAGGVGEQSREQEQLHDQPEKDSDVSESAADGEPTYRRPSRSSDKGDGDTRPNSSSRPPASSAENDRHVNMPDEQAGKSGGKTDENKPDEENTTLDKQDDEEDKQDAEEDKQKQESEEQEEESGEQEKGQVEKEAGKGQQQEQHFERKKQKGKRRKEQKQRQETDGEGEGGKRSRQSPRRRQRREQQKDEASAEEEEEPQQQRRRQAQRKVVKNKGEKTTAAVQEDKEDKGQEKEAAQQQTDRLEYDPNRREQKDREHYSDEDSASYSQDKEEEEDDVSTSTQSPRDSSKEGTPRERRRNQSYRKPKNHAQENNNEEEEDDDEYTYDDSQTDNVESGDDGEEADQKENAQDAKQKERRLKQGRKRQQRAGKGGEGGEEDEDSGEEDEERREGKGTEEKEDDKQDNKKQQGHVGGKRRQKLKQRKPAREGARTKQKNEPPRKPRGQKRQSQVKEGESSLDSMAEDAFGEGEVTEDNERTESARHVAASDQHVTPSPRRILDEDQIRAWTRKDVDEWLAKFNLKGPGSKRHAHSAGKCKLEMYHCPVCRATMDSQNPPTFKKKSLDSLTGSDLVFLYRLRSEAPELFYSNVSSGLQLRTMRQADKFVTALDSLSDH